jgi:hypothetical protein
MIRNANARDGLFGVIYLSASSGAIISAYLTHGVHGDERCFNGGPRSATVIRSWVAVTNTPLTVDRDLDTYWAQLAAQSLVSVVSGADGRRPLPAAARARGR